jgi:outer membrane murein-binding lipoprotein Lpp
MGGESPDSNFEESEYDPRLEQKIEQIKKNIKAGSNSNSQANTNT